MKTKIFALILCLTMLLTAVLPMSVSAEEIELQNATPPGALAISELNAAPPVNGVSYQYIEIVNLSTKTVDLSNYYLYRWGFSNTTCASDYQGWQQMYGTNGTANTPKRLTLNGSVKAGETIVVWLWIGEDACPANASAFINYWKTTLQKGSTWTISNVAIVDASDYPATGIKEFDEEKYPGANAANGGFLPGQRIGCMVDLIHKDAKMKIGGNIVTAANDPLTTASLTNSANSTAANENGRRHAAADCSVIFYTGIPNGTGTNGIDAPPIETATISHNYYSFVDPELRSTAATEVLKDPQFDTIKNQYAIGLSQTIPTLATGKRNADGSYGLGAGLRIYKSKGTLAACKPESTSATVIAFVDDGTKETATPGTLNEGQYDTTLDLVVYGAQNKLVTIEQTTTQTVRFVGYVGDVSQYSEIGFKVFIQKIETLQNGQHYNTKAVAIDTVYKAISVNDVDTNVSEITRNANDEGYLMAFAVSDLPISTTETEQITIYVTPYGVIDNGDDTTTTVYGKRIALDLEVFDALNAAN